MIYDDFNCPTCGQVIEIEIKEYFEEQNLTIDCDECMSFFTVRVYCEIDIRVD